MSCLRYVVLRNVLTSEPLKNFCAIKRAILFLSFKNCPTNKSRFTGSSAYCRIGAVSAEVHISKKQVSGYAITKLVQLMCQLTEDLPEVY